jgi:hypothetical protein
VEKVDWKKIKTYHYCNKVILLQNVNENDQVGLQKNFGILSRTRSKNHRSNEKKSQ